MNPTWRSPLATSLAVAIAYFAVGQLGLLLVIPPGYASPLYPAAGLALAALLSLGQRHVVGIALGSISVNLIVGHQRGVESLLAPVLIGCGAALQAWVGAWAVRRWVPQPLLLSEPRDLAAFFLIGAGVAGLISPTVGTGALLLAGALPPELLGRTWTQWWVGDAMGVLIAAPIVLTLIGRPRKAWVARRLSVGLPMAVVTVLIALGTLTVAQWDEQRARSNFERDAATTGNALTALLREPLMALEAARGLLLVAPQLSRSDFEIGTARYVLPGSPLLAIGLARVTPRDQVSAFNAAAQADGLPDFTARDRQRAGDLTPPADEPMLAIRLIEPLARNRTALGVNILSIPVARTAISAGQKTGEAAATAGFQLSQDGADTTGVVVYQALYTDDQPAQFKGVVFATVRPDEVLRRVAQQMPEGLALCLVDTDPSAARPRLAGAVGCESLLPRPSLLVPVLPLHREPITFGMRSWEVRVYAPGGLRLDDGRSWPFALVGLLATALLGALLLMVTGRARLVEVLVRARTAQLKRQVAEREVDAKALRDSEQRFRNIFDNAQIGIIFADLNGAMQEVNPYFCRLIGYTAEQLQQLSTHDITAPEDYPEDQRLGRQLLRGEIPMYRRNKRYFTASGAVLQVRVVVTLLRDGERRPFRLVGVVEDIGDQLKMQVLERARQSAEAANQAKNEFLSRTSHELRTPLNAMLGFAQLLEIDANAPLSAVQKTRVAQIQQAGWHLLDMINDTLDLSRIESGALKLEPARLDLNRLLDDACALVETDACARHITLHRSLASDAVQALGDATRVKQVLTNLLSNAVKYNVDGGSITINSQRAGEDQIEVSVSDSGLGLSAEQQRALFQPYNRLGREHGSATGTGIGLVISQRLAEMMGGSLSASSVEGQGSRFALRLPATTSDSVPPPTERPTAPPASAYTGRRCLFYIEDNAVNAEVMRGILAQRPQIELQVFNSGQAGLDAINASPPDLLLLDMQLPDMDGLSLLQRLRQTPAGRSLPVVGVSANAMPEQRRAAELAGLQHYLTKPVDMPALLVLLDRLLRDTSPESD